MHSKPLIDIANLCGSRPDGMLVADVYISNTSTVEVSGCGMHARQLLSHKIPVLPLTFKIPLPSPSPHLTFSTFNLFPPRYNTVRKQVTHKESVTCACLLTIKSTGITIGMECTGNTIRPNHTYTDGMSSPLWAFKGIPLSI